MSQYFETPVVPDTAAAAVAQYLRVKTPGAVAVAGALDQSFGTMELPCVAAGPCSVRVKTAEGTQKMVAATAITKGNYVYGAASGKVSAVANGNVEGIAKETVTADGDIIEVQPINQTVQNGVTLAAASGAIALVPGTVVITKTGSLAAMTLAAPTAAQDGLLLTVTSATAFAHTITATSLIEDGVTGGAKTTATFAAFAGATIVLVAYNLKWHTVSLKAVTVA
jgi:hypothetical protein